ncbi:MULTISPECIES: HlyD family type I secretion periplasmic adaptor subunit [Bradyrhizobium]|uniref:HlyD family type I secretion periplasmic adaptor subunit n=1 Tax=Bradyrhizobium TaxID=374 RepID=UPI001E3A89B4|nr:MULTISPECIES: HlyD family type I secretion periplasmic adaptor subunit [Bradyrhizobium]UFW48242.1 HlyD family type I secretion periplasmic adaptor subunit [Bradyrhizobium arachidis]
MIWDQLMRAPTSPSPARRSGVVVTAIDDFEPLEFPWCSTPTPISPRGRLRGITVAGNLLVLCFMLGLGTWASLAPLESAAIASGVVESESSRKTIQHLEGGIVSKILVSDGDIVRSGQTLIALEDTRASSEVQSLQGQFWDAAARAARLQAEQQRFDKIAIPDALEQDSRQSGVAAAAVSAQQFIFQARLQVHESQIAVIRERRRQVEKEIEGLKAQETATGQRVDIVREELDMVATLVNKGLERRPRLLNLQRELAEVEGRRGETAAQIARAGQVISEQQATLFKLESERQNEIAQSLREAQNQIFQLRERLLAARDQLSRTEVKAPEDGVITDLRVHTAGGVIGAGAPLMDLVPRQDRLIVTARLRPEDIDVVHPGLHAEVHLVPYNQRRVPRLKGTVVHVSADRLLDKRTDQPYYATKIRIDDGQIAANDIQIVPGMPVQVFITTGRGTVALYALRPLLDSFRGAFRED